MKLTWPHVVLVGLVLAAIVLLALRGQDTTALIGLGIGLFGGLGLIAGKTEAIQKQTNGNQTEMLRILRDLAVRLADSTPPVPEQPEEPKELPRVY